jgi:hypothetical protein
VKYVSYSDPSSADGPMGPKPVRITCKGSGDMIWNRDPWSRPKLADGESQCAVFCVDPGGTSGWCFGLFEVSSSISVTRSIEDAVARCHVKFGQVETNPVWTGGGSLGSGSFTVRSSPTESLYELERRAVGELYRRMAGANDWVERHSSKCVGSDASSRPVPLAGLTHIVCEDFILNRMGSDRALLSPVRLNTGLYNILASGDSEVDCDWHLQSPSDKSVVTDEQLKSLDLWFKGQQHARDAARHMVLFLRRLTASVGL